MANYVKTKEDLEIEAFDMRTNKALKYIRDVGFYKFNLGDILVREDNHSKQGWKRKEASNGVPYRYVYLFENDLGVGYIRRMSVTGKHLVDKPICVVEFDPDTTRFILDPGYADHLLFGESEDNFDLKSDYAEAKKKREAIYKANLKIKEDFSSDALFKSFMDNLKVGDTLWISYSTRTLYDEPIRVESINKDPNTGEYSFITYTTERQRINGWTPSWEKCENLRDKSVFAQKPFFFKDLI